jgi:hypothetical protein
MSAPLINALLTSHHSPDNRIVLCENQENRSLVRIGVLPRSPGLEGQEFQLVPQATAAPAGPLMMRKSPPQASAALV